MFTEKKKILIVDYDDDSTRLIAGMLSGNGYEYETAKNGVDALVKAGTYQPDLIYLDVMLPEMNGFDTCKGLKLNPTTKDIPVVMITAIADADFKLKGIAVGASDYLTKPVDTTELLMRTRNLLMVKEYQDFLKEYSRILENQINRKLNELKASYIDTIYRLAMAAEFKDENTGQHIKRMSSYCKHLAMQLGFPEQEADIMFYASPMHDIGKIGIPDHILTKRGPLLPEEYDIMKTHTTIGGRILHGSDTAILVSAEKFALYHHERWDGSGYPQGLKGEDIPVEGRILSIVDQYDALRSGRSYKPPLSHEEALRIMTEGDGRTKAGHFDPAMFEVFKATIKRFEEIYENTSKEINLLAA